MALSLYEELTLLQEVESDSGAGPSVKLSELIYRASVGYSLIFLSGTKDTSGSELAAVYLSRITNLCNRINRKTDLGNTVDSLLKIFVSIVGDDYTWAQVSGATDTQWASFVTSNISSVFEVAAGVNKQEADAYSAL